MKIKKIIGLIATIVIAAVAVIHVNIAAQEKGTYNITSTKVEALSKNENEHPDANCGQKYNIEEQIWIQCSASLWIVSYSKETSYCPGGFGWCVEGTITITRDCNGNSTTHAEGKLIDCGCK